MSITENQFVSLAYMRYDLGMVLNYCFPCAAWVKNQEKISICSESFQFCSPKKGFQKIFSYCQFLVKLLQHTYLPPIASSCGWAPAVFLCERRSDPPGLLLGRLDIGTSLLKGHTLSRHYHSLKERTGKNQNLSNAHHTARKTTKS